jgi:Flp pilus assembly protein TadD
MAVQNNLASPVFLHSSFRTSSTWLWTKFRADPRALALNEYFNDILARISVVTALTHDPTSWRSGHPATDPYFLEFVPLIGPTGGVMGYSRDMAIEGFIPDGGVGGDISEAERRYVATLIGLAQAQGKVPVLADTLSLGRFAGLKRAFGGFHILLVRNLFQQWNSYSHQHREGNSFFVESVVSVLLNKNGDEYKELLLDYMNVRCGFNALKWCHEENYDHLFVVFCALHLYLSMKASVFADLTIDVNQLAAHADDRRLVEQRIHDACGLTVDLGDLQSTSQQPYYALRDARSMWTHIAILFERAIECVGGDEDAIRFGRRLYDEGLAACCSVDAVSASASETHSLDDASAFYAGLLYSCPDNTDYSDRLCRIYVRQGKLHEALGLTDRAMRLNPQSADALTRHGEVLTALRRDVQAQACFEKAQAIRGSRNTV